MPVTRYRINEPPLHDRCHVFLLFPSPEWCPALHAEIDNLLSQGRAIHRIPVERDRDRFFPLFVSIEVGEDRIDIQNVVLPHHRGALAHNVPLRILQHLILPLFITDVVNNIVYILDRINQTVHFDQL